MREFLDVLIPVEDNKLPVESVVALEQMARWLQRQLSFGTSVEHGIPSARTFLFQLFKKTGRTRALLLDSDILISNPMETAMCLQDADQAGRNIVGVYNGVADPSAPWNVATVVSKTFESHGLIVSIPAKEIEDSDNFMPIAWAGLGFYYGDLPLDYEFHADNKSEDWHFFKDNPQLHPVIDKRIKLRHQKRVYI